MPPKKRAACNPHKQRLVFLESPQEGLVHEYGAAPSKAETKCVPAKSLDRDACTSWVTPQFAQAAALDFPVGRRRQYVSNDSTVRSRDVNRSQLRAPGRKQSVCKFPSLAFRTADIVETPPLCPSRRPMTVPASPPISEERPCGDIPSPPDIQTPEASPKQNPLPSATTVALQTPFSRREVEAPDTLLAHEPRQVLAEDTPEHEYGVRLTWRRRQGLMKYLKSRGRLKSSQILVKR